MDSDEPHERTEPRRDISAGKVAAIEVGQGGQLVFSHVLNEVSICDVGFGVMNELLPHNEPKLNRLSAAGNHEEDKEALPVAVCSFNFGIGCNESLV